MEIVLRIKGWALINHFVKHTRWFLVFKWWPEIVDCHFLVKNLHYRSWHGSESDKNRVENKQKSLSWIWKNLRHNPNPISRTSIPQFGFVFIMLHEAFTCSMMINDCDVVLLIWMQNCNINFNKCLIFPQRARISSVQSHFNCYRLLNCKFEEGRKTLWRINKSLNDVLSGWDCRKRNRNFRFGMFPKQETIKFDVFISKYNSQIT